MSVDISAALRACKVVHINRCIPWLTDGVLSDMASDQHFYDLLSKCCDPDLALLSLVRICEQDIGKSIVSDALAKVEHSRFAENIFNVLGFSRFFGDFLFSHVEHLRYLDSSYCDFFSNCQRADDDSGGYKFSFGTKVSTPDELRQLYWGYLLAIVAQDLSSCRPVECVPKITACITALVDATVECALNMAVDSVGLDERVSIAVMAMGKAGAAELNYISDVDVIYLYALNSCDKDESLSDSQCYQQVVAVLAEISNIVNGDLYTAYPKLWPLDTGLRPEGKDGALAKTLDSCKVYYTKWAKDWEFQALLKCRFMAGDYKLGSEFLDFVQPLVWNISANEDFVDNCRAMRKKIENNIVSDSKRNIKLGSGGLRDIEFSVQLLQLVHGRLDDQIHCANTFGAISQLSEHGYIARDKAKELDCCYAFLRLLEHRLQVYKMKRTHVLPTDTRVLNTVARSLGIAQVTDAQSLEKYWYSKAVTVRGLHKDIFYSPILPATSKLSKQAFVLNSKYALDRLEAIGFTNTGVAMNNIVALTQGLSRRAVIHRHLLPVLLEWMSQGANPDNALLNFRILSETIGNSHWYLGFLRDSNIACKNLCTVLANSSYVASQLVDFPEGIRWLENLDELQPKSPQVLKQEIDSLISRYDDSVESITHIRRIRSRELLRCAIADCVLGVSCQRYSYISALNDLSIYGAYIVALRQSQKEFGYKFKDTSFSIDLFTEQNFSLCDMNFESDQDMPTLDFAFGVLAMGRLGGNECVYGSDADVLYVYSCSDSALGAKIADFIAFNIKKLLGEINEEASLEVDLGLRPEGRNGAMARSLAAYENYFENWSQTWERQALLRCRPIVGTCILLEKFMAKVDSIRYGSDISTQALMNIRRLKARMDVQRLPRGIKPARHLKFGPGGLSDVEWTIQILQLKHAHTYAQLRTTNTQKALDQALTCKLLSADDHNILSSAYTACSKIRTANALATGKLRSKDNDILPKNPTVNRCVNYLLGNATNQLWKVQEEYLNLARHAHGVYERIFFEP